MGLNNIGPGDVAVTGPAGGPYDVEFRGAFAGTAVSEIQILDVQVSLTRAHFNAVAALAEYNSALALWLRATGRVR